MYMNFYKLKKAPFHITPDPEFLFLSASHKEALGAIIYCIEKRKGFVSVIGEVGTGKTTIIRAYLAKSNRKQVKPIYVFNASITFRELLKTIFHELGITIVSGNVYDLVLQLQKVLIDEYKQGSNIVLIIDEAQNMPVKTLEQLRILSNLETPKEKLIQIILAGQPELNDKLNLNELRQLKQRLAIRATLQPLSVRESHDYIRYRLSQAAATSERLFTNSALNRIVKHAQGSPRKLNILCDNALIAGFGYRKERISDKIVKQVIEDFEGKGRTSLFNWRFGLLFGGGALAITALVGFFRAPSLPQGHEFADQKVHNQVDKPAIVKEILTRHRGPASKEVTHARHERQDAKREVGIVDSSDHLLPGFVPLHISSPSQKKIHVPAGEPHIAKPIINQASEVEPPKAAAIAKQDTQASGSRPGIADSQIVPPLKPMSASTARQGDVPVELTRRFKRIHATTRMVKKGQYLSQICLEIYGYVDNSLIQRVKNSNPDIHDADLILIGEKIYFPELLKPVKEQLTHKEDNGNDKNI